jgi:DNA (cytosine-5)-methyltransferase 1
MRLLDLFSGIGGFSLGLERAGFQTVAFCEIDPFCRRVLAKHWPHVPCYDDITTLTAERLATDGIEVDAISGGFPCQDISLAGSGAGLAGARSGLWREFLRTIRLVRPDYVIVENVAALLCRGLGEILGDLAEIGYDTEWHCIRASDVGAIHERDRIWIIAYPVGTRGPRLVSGKNFSPPGSWWLRGEEDLQSVCDAPFERGNCWPQPLLRRMDDGLPGRLDRLHAVGNSVIPQIPEIIGRAIMEADRLDTQAEQSSIGTDSF